MSTNNFIIHEHVVATQHIRELPNALAVSEGTLEATLHLSVKQYIPRNNVKPQAGDITLVAFHANGYNKEIYEPLWDDLLDSLPDGVRLRGIWMADMAQHGSSYVMNEQKLAIGISWDDHARDVLHLMNCHRDQMVPPIVGIGHSMGAAQLVQLCKIHPRLFHSVALLDPWFSLMCEAQHPDQLWQRSIRRKQVFQSTDLARTAFEKVPLYKTWDRRCFDRYILTAFRELPTMLETGDSGVAPITPAIMTFHTARRVNMDAIDVKQQTASRADKLAYPDLIYDLADQWPFCMPQAIHSAQSLPHLRPRVLFLYGDKGSVIDKESRETILKTTGGDSGGSGGARLGCVEDDVINGGHFFVFENPEGTAKRLASWLVKEQSVWRKEKLILDKRYSHGKSAQDQQRFPPRFDAIARAWAAHASSKL